MKSQIILYLVLFISLNLSLFGQQSSVIKENADLEKSVSNPQVVSYCDLMNKPETYVGKVIRLEATFKNLVTLESIINSDCEPTLSAVSVGIATEKLDKTSNELLSKVDTLDNKRITVIGKFLGPRKPNLKFNYGHYGWSKYLFEIHAFEKIESIPKK